MAAVTAGAAANAFATTSCSGLALAVAASVAVASALFGEAKFKTNCPAVVFECKTYVR